MDASHAHETIEALLHEERKFPPDPAFTAQASANDAGTVTGAGFAAWNWRLGLDAATLGGVRVQPTLSIENLFDRRYASSLVINATRNRFFEPGLPRRVSFLMSLQWR